LLEARIDFFRPISDAMDEEGNISPDHYWWEAIRPDNWMLTTSEVVSTKANMFPVFGERSKVPWDRRSLELVKRDNPVLLNPYEDDPWWYIQFPIWHIQSDYMGRRELNESQTILPVELKQIENSKERAWASIKAYNLASESLLIKRKKSVDKFRMQANYNFHADQGPGQISFQVDTPHLGAVRQVIVHDILHEYISKRYINQESKFELLRTWCDAFYQELSVALCLSKTKWHLGSKEKEIFSKSISYGLEKFPGLKEVLDSALDVKSRERLRQPKPPQPLLPLKEKVIIEANARLVKVDITNFKNLIDVSIDVRKDLVNLDELLENLNKSSDAYVPWRMLLGENGTGKSSVLQAIALALMSKDLEEHPKLGRKEFWEKIIRRGAEWGSIALEFLTGEKIHLIFFRDGTFEFRDAVYSRLYVRGYGSIRLLPCKEFEDDVVEHASDRIRIDNLFDPRHSLTDVEKLLVDMDNEDFNIARVMLESLLHFGTNKENQNEGDL
jgi:hypothetical protein